MKKIILILITISLAGLPAGCSKEATRAAIYEGMRFKSNEVNAQNPNYDSDRVPSYTEYKAQRDQYIEDRKD